VCHLPQAASLMCRRANCDGCLPKVLQKETCPLNNAIVVLVSSSLALLVITLALVREVRLRRALQRLLARLLAHFRGKEP
jgi:hypothetical protein